MNYIFSSLFLIAIFYTFNNINVEGLIHRIIGGLRAEPGQIKYLVAIYHDDKYICGGGIIGNIYVITAAHCVINSTTNKFKKGKFKIIAGSDYLKVYTPSTIEIEVKQIYAPKVNRSFRSSPIYSKGDIAVLELKNSLHLAKNKDLQKLHLPSVDVEFSPNDEVYKRFPAETAGFGKDGFTKYIDKDGKRRIRWKASRKLLTANVLILDRNDCEKSYPSNFFDSTIICGKVQNYKDGTPQGTCRGDSGSPLVQNGTTVIGVISASSKFCNDNNKPGIYTKVASYKKFIKNVKLGITDNMRVRM